MSKNITKNKTKSKQVIYQISLCGFLIALLIIIKAIFKFVDIINGYSPQIQLVVYCLGLIVIQNKWFKIGFYLLAPFATMVFGISGNIFLDYLVPYYGFFLFLSFDFITKNIKTYKIKNIIFIDALIIIFSFVGYGIMSLSYIYSGVIFYHTNLYSSFLINFPIVVISFGINLLIMLLTTFPIMQLIKKYDDKIFW